MQTQNCSQPKLATVRKILYYLMLIVFSICTVWNALSKKASILGPTPTTVESPQQKPTSDWAFASQFLK
jgi:hypothetical protein